MTMDILTIWNMSIWSDGELFHDALWGNPGLLEVTPHLSCSRLMRSVGGSNLNSMVLCLIKFELVDVRCDLAILQLQKKHGRT